MVPSDKFYCLYTVTQDTFPNTTFFTTIAQQKESIALRYVIACNKQKHELGLRGISKGIIVNCFEDGIGERYGMFLSLLVFGVLIVIVLGDFCTEVLKNVSNVIQVRQKMRFVRFSPCKI